MNKKQTETFYPKVSLKDKLIIHVFMRRTKADFEERETVAHPEILQ